MKPLTSVCLVKAAHVKQLSSSSSLKVCAGLNLLRDKTDEMGMIKMIHHISLQKSYLLDHFVCLFHDSNCMKNSRSYFDNI